MTELDCRTCKGYKEKDYCTIMDADIKSWGCQLYYPKYQINSVTEVIDHCRDSIRLLNDFLLTGKPKLPFYNPTRTQARIAIEIYESLIEEIEGEHYTEYLKEKMGEIEW